MGDEQVAISIRNVVKSYDGGKTFAVRGISFDVAQGEFIALVGTSGSGKTTLLKLLNRLIEPSEGMIILEGRDITSVDEVTLRRGIGYVFQGVGLFPHLTVAENIAATPKLLGWPTAAIAARVAELLDLVRLPAELATRMPAQLSGGQRQRVGVARALAAKPPIMLMDEPFGAVDPITRDALVDDFRRLRGVLGFTTVMITHDVLEAILLADRIAIVHEGKIVESGTPHDLLSGASSAYVRELMAMPRRQAERVQALAASDGSG